jgi:hypothetical protein
MLRLKVHFAQVPLTVAKKVLADQLRRKKARERAQLTRKKSCKRPLDKVAVVNEVKRG